ncbi:MAG: hypothetical protein QOH25_4105 [Acidobacteriota bacterium]|jgi:hypothetical protein|nr:hypothetical protein [Acidobacteriota bacterium]
MKSRRLTIFCVAVMVLAGTPRAWQEVNKLLAVIQHKAQAKFWSMVLQPKERESADGEMVAAAQLFETIPAKLDSNCPLDRQESQGEQAASSSKAGRRTDSASAQPKARAPRQTASAPSSHASLIAKSFKALREKSNVEFLVHFRSIPESQRSEVIAESSPASLPLPRAAALPHPPASKSDTFRFVMIPAINPVASSLVEKESLLQLKMLKKTIEENKWIRQKDRPKVRNADFGVRI